MQGKSCWHTVLYEYAATSAALQLAMYGRVSKASPACCPHRTLLFCRELITSEIVYWLYQVLTGQDAELLSWPAAASFASQRKQMGLGAGNLQDWVQDLLKKVVFKVHFLHCKVSHCSSACQQPLCNCFSYSKFYRQTCNVAVVFSCVCTGEAPV